MSMSNPVNHLGSIWYHSKPLEVSYSPNQFLGWDFDVSYSKPALEVLIECYWLDFDVLKHLISTYKYKN